MDSAPLLLASSGGGSDYYYVSDGANALPDDDSAMATCRTRSSSRSSSRGITARCRPSLAMARPSSSRSLMIGSGSKVGKLFSRSSSSSNNNSDNASIRSRNPRSSSMSNKPLVLSACRARVTWERKNTSSTSCLSGSSNSSTLSLEVNTEHTAMNLHPCMPAPSSSLSPTCVAGFDSNSDSVSFFGADFNDDDDIYSVIDGDRTSVSFFSSVTAAELLAATISTNDDIDHSQLPHMPPELYGDVSTYLLPNQEVGNLLLAVSASSRPTDRRAVATIIRTTFLRRNYAYLAHSWIKPYAKRQANVREWMTVNTDWKELYANEEAQRSGIFNLIFGNLMRATEVGLVDICRHLIEERGANINQEEVEPMLAMHRGETSRRRIATVRPIMVAFKLPDAHVLRYYLEKVKDLDLNYFINERCGLRFVHQIVSLRYAGKSEHLRLLLQNRRNVAGGEDDMALDINARVDNGMTCLHLFMGRKTMPSDAVQRLKILLEAGADPTLRDVNGNTPMAIFKKRTGDKLNRAERKTIKVLLRCD